MLRWTSRTTPAGPRASRGQRFSLSFATSTTKPGAKCRSVCHQAAGRGKLRHRHSLPGSEVGQPGWGGGTHVVNGTYNSGRGFAAMLVNGEVDGRVHFVA